MKVVFTQDHGSARADDIKEVASGYARYLLRFGKADVATPELIAQAEARQAERIEQLKKDQESARKVAEKFADVVLEFAEKANEEGHLFGSVAEMQIAEAVTNAVKVEISKDQVRMGGHIKEVGESEVKIHLMEGVDAFVKVVVTAAE